MNVRVVCRKYGAPPAGVAEKVIWRGEMDTVPRVDEQVYLDGDGPVCNVQDVEYGLTDGVATVWLRPDKNNEFLDWDSTPHYGVDA